MNTKANRVYIPEELAKEYRAEALHNNLVQAYEDIKGEAMVSSRWPIPLEPDLLQNYTPYTWNKIAQAKYDYFKVLETNSSIRECRKAMKTFYLDILLAARLIPAQIKV